MVTAGALNPRAGQMATPEAFPLQQYFKVRCLEMAWFLSSHPVSPLLPGTHMAFQTSHAPCTGLRVPRTDWSSHAVSTSPNRAPVCAHVTHVPKQNRGHHSPRERCSEQNRFLNTHTSHRLMRAPHSTPYTGLFISPASGVLPLWPAQPPAPTCEEANSRVTLTP